MSPIRTHKRRNGSTHNGKYFSDVRLPLSHSPEAACLAEAVQISFDTRPVLDLHNIYCSQNSLTHRPKIFIAWRISSRVAVLNAILNQPSPSLVVMSFSVPDSASVIESDEGWPKCEAENMVPGATRTLASAIRSHSAWISDSVE